MDARPRSLFAEFTISGNRTLEFVRDLDAEELQKLDSVREFLASITFSSPYEVLSSSIDALATAAGPRADGGVPTKDVRERVTEALAEVVRSASKSAALWNNLVGPDPEDVEARLGEFESSMLSAGLDVLISIVDSGDLVNIVGSEVTLPDGREVAPILEVLNSHAEVMAATAILAMKARINEASRWLMDLRSEVLLGNPLIAERPTSPDEMWSPEFESLPMHLLYRAQELLKISAHIQVPDVADAVAIRAEDDQSVDQGAALDTDGGTASVEDSEAGEEVVGIAMSQPPTVGLGDLLSHLCHEARLSLRAWSEALNIADLGESREKLLACTHAIAAEMMRRSEGSSMAIEFPPSIQTISKLDPADSDSAAILDSVGEIHAFGMLLDCVNRYTHVIEMKLSEGEVEYMTFDPEAATRAIALAGLLRDVSPGPSSDGRQLAGRAVQSFNWGLPEAAMLYTLAQVPDNSEQMSDDLRALVEVCRSYLSRLLSTGESQVGVSVSLAASLIGAMRSWDSDEAAE